MMRLLLTVLLVLYCSIFFGQGDLELRDSVDYVKVLKSNSPVSKDELKELIEYDKSIDKSMFEISNSFSFSGLISIGYDYGFPFSLNGQFGLNAGYWVNGTNQVQLSGIPMNLNYAYRQNSINPGLENFFRLDFDSQKYRNQQNEIKNQKIKFNNNIIDSLKQERISTLKALYAVDLDDLNSFDSLKGFDSFEGPHHDCSDPIGKFEIKKEYENKYNLNGDFNISTDSSLQRIITDSAIVENSELSSKLDTIQVLREKLIKSEIGLQKYTKYNGFLNRSTSDLEETASFNRISDFLMKIERFQIGQVTPSFTNVVLAGFPMNGISIKYVDRTKKETHLIHGQLININPIFDNPRSKFLRSFFSDIVPTSQNIGDRITAFKRDIFRNDNFELAITGLFGLDKFSNENRPYGFAVLGRNAVYGLFIKRNTERFGCFTLDIAQSATVSLNVLSEGGETLRRPTRGEIVQFLWDWRNKKRGIILKNNFRLTSPNYHSLGNAFLRGNQIRNDLSFSMRIFSHTNVNVGSTYLISNVFSPNIGISETMIKRFGLQVKPGKKLILRANYNYSINRFKLNSLNFNGNSWSFIFSKNYTKREKNTFYSSILTMSLFRIQSDTLNEGLSEVREQLEIQLPNNRIVLVEISGFRSNTLNDREAGGIAGLGLRTTFKKRFSIQMNGRILLTQDERAKLGYGLTSETKITDSISCALMVEKVVLDYFITEDLKKLYDAFPYRFSATFKYNF